MKHRDILDLVKKQSVYVDNKSLSYTAGMGKAGIKKPKEELIDAVMEYVSSDWDLLNDYMLECRQELALNPKTLEETIGCTEEERHRWTEDGRLEVVCNKEFGNEKFAPYYSIYQVAYEISDEVLIEWREEDEEDDNLTRYWFQIKDEIFDENNDIGDLASGFNEIEEDEAKWIIEDKEKYIKRLERQLKKVARLENGYILCVSKQHRIEELPMEYAICKMENGEDEIVLRGVIPKEYSKENAVDAMLCLIDKYGVKEVYFNEWCDLETKEIEEKIGTSVRIVLDLSYFGLYGSKEHNVIWEKRITPLYWTTRSYKYQNGFVIDVTERDTKDGLLYDVFLSHIDYGDKKHVFGLLKKDLEKEGINDWNGVAQWNGLLQLILDNIDRYIELYRDEVMD